MISLCLDFGIFAISTTALPRCIKLRKHREGTGIPIHGGAKGFKNNTRTRQPHGKSPVEVIHIVPAYAQ